MPRKAGIDAPGALDHVIAKGIENGLVFRDHFDPNNFLDRFDTIIDATDTRWLVWALLPNYLHLLVKTGRVPIAASSGVC